MDWEGEVRDNPYDPTPLPHMHGGGADGDENKERCVICLMALRDRTIVGVCGHEFCVCVLTTLQIMRATFILYSRDGGR